MVDTLTILRTLRVFLGSDTRISSVEIVDGGARWHSLSGVMERLEWSNRHHTDDVWSTNSVRRITIVSWDMTAI